MELKSIKEARTELEKHLLFLAWLSEEFRRMGKNPPILVDGSAVEIYSYGHYMSGDIDLVGNREMIRDILLSTGYFREHGRLFISDELGLFVEVPDYRLSGSYEKVRRIKAKELGVDIYVIGLEDLILDRLSACKFWKSEEDCRMSEFLIRKYLEELDIEYLQNRATELGVYEELYAILYPYEGNKHKP